MNNKGEWSRLFDVVCIVLFALGAIGGIAYLFYYDKAVFGVAAMAITAMAVPFLVERIKHLTGE